MLREPWGWSWPLHWVVPVGECGLSRFSFCGRSLSGSSLLAEEFCMALGFRLGSSLVSLCPGVLEVLHLFLLLLGDLLRLG